MEYRTNVDTLEIDIAKRQKELESMIELERKNLRVKRPQTPDGKRTCKRCYWFSMRLEGRAPDQDHTMSWKCENCGFEDQTI